MKKYMWEISSVMLALVAIIAAYNIFFMGRSIKALQIKIDSATPLAIIPSEVNNTLQVVYKGKVIKNPQLLQITIKNSGNQSITQTDFTTPLLFTFNPQDEIIDAAVIRSQPSNIGVSLYYHTKFQIIARVPLLNPGETVTIHFVIAESGNDPILNHFRVGGRIIGIKAFGLIPLSDQQPGFWEKILSQYVWEIVLGFVAVLELGLVMKRRLDKKQSPKSL